MLNDGVGYGRQLLMPFLVPSEEVVCDIEDVLQHQVVLRTPYGERVVCGMDGVRSGAFSRARACHQAAKVRLEVLGYDAGAWRADLCNVEFVPPMLEGGIPCVF